MKTIIIESYEKGKIRLIEKELEEVHENEVLFKCIYSAVSPGTELAWIWHMQNTPGIYPYYPGYSSFGVIDEIGDNVTSLKKGDFVIARTFHSAYSVLREDQVTILNNGVDAISASAYRLASISLQGVRKADIQIGDDVAVIGLGAIGNLAAQIAKVAGSGNVVGFDLVDWRRGIAEQCGLDNLEADGSSYLNKFDVVFEATGVPSVVNTAIEMVKPLGKLVLLGSSRGLTDGVNFYKVHRNGISIIGAHEMYRSRDDADRFGHFRSGMEDERTIQKLLENGKINIRPLVSEIAEPRNAQAVYKRLWGKNEKLILVAFDWRNF